MNIHSAGEKKDISTQSMTISMRQFNRYNLMLTRIHNNNW